MPTHGMAEYKIILDGLRHFGVEISSANGFRSVRSFLTEIAAVAWIEVHKALEAPRQLRRNADGNQASPPQA